MGITINQIILALVFVSIVMAVEGIFYFLRGSDARELAANRRMKVAQKRDTSVMNPTIMREEVMGGVISRGIFSLVPVLENLFWVANVSIKPAVAVAGVLVFAGLIFTGLVMFVTMPVPIAAGFAGMVGIALPFLVLKSAADGQRKKFSEQLPTAINLISRGLQAGHPVPVAFELVAKEMEDPLGGQFGRVLDEINFGRDRDVALRDVARKFPDPDFKFFLAAIEMQRETGGNLVEILDNLSKIIRERANMRKKAWAISSEGRMTMMIVGALPYLLLAYFLLTNPSFILDAVDHSMFWPLMGGAQALWVIGIIWIWNMIHIKV